ncbi:MAG: hypothetical protein Q7K43_00535 [Candidatus Woesearchaeota archaeon]|nr:hypothetical protein [Candidatus Woesearchaeota archaeon]
MSLSKLVILLIMFILASLLVFGATIQGTVYDAELSVVKQAVVSINSAPDQLMVANLGWYKFVIAPGSYVVSANHSLGSANFSITINSDGEYIHDIILFPTFSVSDLENQSTIELSGVEHEFQPAISWTVLIVIVIAVLVTVLFIKEQNKTHKSPDKNSEASALNRQVVRTSLDELEQALSVLRKEGGRMTQKEMRKAIPFSEAKVSLIIADLEHTGKIEKIKKGRGNIIILK